MRSVARAASTTTVRMRCVPHFAQVQPDDSARAIGANGTGSRISIVDRGVAIVIYFARGGRGQPTPTISLTRDDQNAYETA
jgi:hypothetical protein